MKRKICAVLAVVLLVFVSACATTGGGGYEAMSPAQKMSMLERIRENLNEYHIYSCGPPGVSSAVIFSPKGGDRRLTGDRCSELKDEESVGLAVHAVNSYHQYNPTLYAIKGEEGALYGYVLIAYYRPRASRVDGRTLVLPNYMSPVYIGPR